MSAITDIRCVLTHKVLNAFCDNFHIPGEVHPVLPNQSDTMHERPSGKIGLYNRFFNYANFILPLSTFLVDVLRHFRINISQLSVIGATKNNHFFWVDVFTCPASFPWHTAKHVTRDPNPVAVDFNAQDYATLVAHPSPFRKFPEAFMCLVGLSRHYTLDEETYPSFYTRTEMVELDIFAFIHTLNPTKVRVVERERNEDEPRLLDTIVGRTIPLLPVAHDRADSELEANVERLFDEGGNGNQTKQGDSARGGPDANIQPVVEAANTVVEDAAPVQSRRQRKRKSVVVDAGEVSYPPKKLREDHGTPSGAFVGDSSHHYGTNVAEAEVNSLIRSFALIMTTVTTTTSTVDPTLVTTEKFVEPSPFGVGSSSTSGTDPITGVFSDLTVFTSVRGMERDQLFTEFNVGAARQISLSAEVRMRVEYNVKEKRRLKSVVESQGELLKAKEEEIESLKARLLLWEAKVAEAIRLRAEASNFETVKKSLRDEKNALRERNVILEKERNALDAKVTELETSAMSKERELTDLNAFVTSVKSQNDSLADRVHELEISSFKL
nr:transposase (putative), gypsy type [Tanacetum cinerariifolium]